MASASTKKALAYRTVEIFAGILGRKLYLKDGPVPKTNGWVIEVPMKDRDMYTLVEHEISHPLFGSDPTAKVLFVEEYSEKVALVANRRGADVSRRSLRIALNMIIGVLEDERVISLWGSLYQGSERKMRQRLSEDTAAITPHASLLELLATVAGGHDPGPGKLSRFEPYFREALRKVRFRDFSATLVTAKWLITQLVSEVIRENRGDDLPSPWEPLPGTAEGPQRAEDDEGPEEDVDQENVAQEGFEEPWQPPEVESTVEERTEALGSMVDRLGSAPRGLRERFDDFEESKYQNAWAEREAKRKVKSAMRVQVKDAEQLERKLSRSAAEMQEIIHKVRTATRNVEVLDDRIRRDAFAKVTFTDVYARDADKGQTDLNLDDQGTVKRLRALFFRVMGRRKNQLDFAGAVIDVPAYIERRLMRTTQPVFKRDGTGRGFKALILVDRSSSMQGQRTKAAERACRIISRSLQFPFVELHIWGFQGFKSEVSITRFERGVEVFDTPKSRVQGYTPLHIAMRVAARFLDEGNESKHLFVISDGFPTHQSRGKHHATKALINFVRAEVRNARRKGISVTGVMIGEDTPFGVYSEVHSDKMRRMFGASRYWRLMSRRNLNSELVRLVTRSFVDYLRAS